MLLVQIILSMHGYTFTHTRCTTQDFEIYLSKRSSEGDIDVYI